MEYIIERSDKRKTLSLGVKADGTVFVKAPTWSKKSYIDEFVNAHEDWLKKRRLLLAEREDAKDSFEIKIGDTIRMFGKAYPITKNDSNMISFDGNELSVPDMSFEILKPVMVQIFRGFAKHIITQLVDEWSQKTGCKYTTVSINGAKKRWASRSSSGRLNFSWHLVFADMDLVEYVVIHELCHTKQMNHSPAFWSEVESYCPDYKAKKKRLNTLYEKLQNQNWE